VALTVDDSTPRCSPEPHLIWAMIPLPALHCCSVAVLYSRNRNHHPYPHKSLQLPFCSLVYPSRHRLDGLSPYQNNLPLFQPSFKALLWGHLSVSGRIDHRTICPQATPSSSLPPPPLGRKRLGYLFLLCRFDFVLDGRLHLYLLLLQRNDTTHRAGF
jgi:hypothetical protein